MQHHFYTHPSLKQQYQKEATLSVDTEIPAFEAITLEPTQPVVLETTSPDPIEEVWVSDLRKKLLKFGITAAGIVLITVASLLVIKRKK